MRIPSEQPEQETSIYNEEIPKSKPTSQRSITLPKVLFLGFILISIILLGFQGKNSSQELAPDFTLNDVQGNEISLSDFRGKVVLLEFMATWCPTCKAENSELLQIRQRYGSQVEIISISTDPSYDNLGRITIYIKGYNISWTVCIDTKGVTRAYNVGFIPALFLIDQNQNIVWQQKTGALASFTVLSEQIDLLL